MSEEKIAEIVKATEDTSLSKEDKVSLISKIHEFEKVIANQPQLEIKTTHHFSKGVYAREIFIPKGALIVGKIHKHECLNIVSKGDISFISIDGAKRVQAPYTVLASPGVKRIGYAHEDTIWTTVHGTNETDLKKIEDEFIAKTYGEVEILTKEEINLIEGVLECHG